MANEYYGESLKLVDFAGIDELNIDFARLTLLLGPQAAGKSIVLKLVYFFRSLGCCILDFYINSEQREGDEANEGNRLGSCILKEFRRFFPSGYYENTMRISYRFYYSGSFRQWTIGIGSKKELFLEDDGLLDEIERCFVKAKTDFESQKILRPDSSDKSSGSILPRRSLDFFLDSRLRELIPNELELFIPAGRSVFTLLDKNKWSLAKRGLRLDPVFTDFGNHYSTFKDFYSESGLSSQLIKNTLKGAYINESGRDYILEDDGRKIELIHTSSGRQELLPLAIVLEVLFSTSLISGSVRIYIEEPEAHLFPKAQKETAYMTAKVLNRLIKQNRDVKILLSSHSPHVMASFNNLIEAGKIIDRDRRKLDRVEKVVPKDAILSPGMSEAYFIEKESKNITETGLIDSQQLDDATDEIYDEFDTLLEMEIEDRAGA